MTSGAATSTQDESAPIMQEMGVAGAVELANMEDTPAYRTLVNAGLLTTDYRKSSFEDIFEGVDLKASSSKGNDLLERCKYGYYCCPVIGCILYHCTHTEVFIPAGHVGLFMDAAQNYLFAQPGMHNIGSVFIKYIGASPLPINQQLQHGNRVILVVEQGYVGLAFDNGQPVLLPPGIHVWTSETLRYKEAVALDQHILKLGPYTLLTVDEGYAAVTQNNGRQQVLEGGHTHLLDHKNWRFEKLMALKIHTDDLEKIKATSADNITMLVTSTVTWKIVDPMLAATMAAETMAIGGATVSSDTTKLKQDVLKQAIASLASFMGGVNYSDSFHMAAQAAQAQQQSTGTISLADEPEAESKTMDNPLYDTARMTNCVTHANDVTKSYGVKILSINILSAVPVDDQLTKALACGAVASAQALQAETAARGNAKAMRIDAEASAGKARIEANGEAEAALIEAKSSSEAAKMIAEGQKKAADLLSASQVAVDLAKIEKSAALVGPNDKFYFGQEASYLSNLILKNNEASGSKTAGVLG
jgi:regulator of protease activity HflC (stomatin/prohibitin superfamily)